MIRLVSPLWLKQRGILGMNRRNVDVIARRNQRSRYPLVDDKLKTKRLAEGAGIAVPALKGVISHQFEVRHLRRILRLSREFVIKPAHGSGGKGILVIVTRAKGRYQKPSGADLSIRDLQYHVSNILSGLYSLGGRQDVAMIEALVHFDEHLAGFSYEGVPDIRVIIYRGYPVMAMMRCSTHSSDGKANLHQGAVGVGLDLSSGRSIAAVQRGRPVSFHPDTGESFNALEVPCWLEILHLAASCFEVTELGYLGVDIVIDRDRGPLILELNARPGLAIQVANQSGLAHRLDAVDGVWGRHLSVEQRVEYSRMAFGRFTG